MNRNPNDIRGEVGARSGGPAPGMMPNPFDRFRAAQAKAKAAASSSSVAAPKPKAVPPPRQNQPPQFAAAPDSPGGGDDDDDDDDGSGRQSKHVLHIILSFNFKFHVNL